MLVCYVQADGTAAVVTPISLPGESEADATARVLAGTPGGEAVSAGLVAALRRADQPAAGELLDPETFRERLLPAYLVIADLDVGTQAKWDRILSSFLPVGRPFPVNLSSPSTAGLVGALVGDGLLTEQQAAAVLQIG